MEQAEYILSLEDKIQSLEKELLKGQKIKNALMNKVEFSMADKTSYSVFETNLVIKDLIDKQKDEMDSMNSELNAKISQLSNIENTLTDSKEKLDSILNSIQDVVWSFSYPDFSILFINPAVKNIYGIEPEEFYKDKFLWIKSVHFEDREKVIDFTNNLKNTEPSQIIYKIIRPDGQIRHILEKKRAILNSDGKIIRIDGVAHDITELKQAEAIIEKSRLQYQLIFESTSDGIIVANKTGKIIDSNNQIMIMLGFRKSEMLSNNLSDFISEDNFNYFQEFINAKSNDEKIHFEIEERHRNGKIMQLEVKCSNFRYEGEKLFIFLITDISERRRQSKIIKQQNIKLQQTELKLKAILDNSNQSFTLIARDLSIIALNSIATNDLERMSGKKFIEGTSFEDYLQPEQFAHVKENILKSLTGEVINEIAAIQYVSNKKHYFSFIYNPVVSSDGSIDYVVFNAIDINDTVVAENAIKEQMNFLRVLLDTIPSPVFCKNTEGVFLECNTAFEEIVGIGRENIIGKASYDIAPKELAESYSKMDQALFDSNKAQKYESEMVSNDGETKYVIFNKAPFNDANNEIAGLIGVILDISERKLIESKLIASQSELQTIYDSTPILMCVVDSNVKIRNANQSFIKHTNWPIAQKQPDTLGGILSCINSYENQEGCGFSNSCPKCPLRASIMDTLKTGRHHEDIEYNAVVLRNGRKVEENFIVSTAAINNLNKIMVLISLQDITHRKAIENEKSKLFEELRVSKDIIEANLYQKNALIEELELSKDNLRVMNAEKDKFFSILAHDLKSPFSLLRTNTEKLIADFAVIEENDALVLLYDIKDSTTSVYKLLENLLDWSRIQTGKFVMKPQEIDIYEIAFNVVYTFASIAKEKGITLSSKVDANTVITADYYMINTIFRNLVSNAIKFTETGGSVSISTKPYERNDFAYIEIVFEDNGVGMEFEQIEDLFKIDKATSRCGTNNEQGTGLGLVLCKEFVEKQDGFLWVDSELGKGSAFHIAFPISK